jgi:hypothetical protein
VSAMVLVVVMVFLFKNSCVGLPNKERANATSEGLSSIICVGALGERFNAATVMALLSQASVNLVGSRALSFGETKLLNLFAQVCVISAPPFQNAAGIRSTFLCIPLVQQS